MRTSNPLTTAKPLLSLYRILHNFFLSRFVTILSPLLLNVLPKPSSFLLRLHHPQPFLRINYEWTTLRCVRCTIHMEHGTWVSEIHTNSIPIDSPKRSISNEFTLIILFIEISNFFFSVCLFVCLFSFRFAWWRTFSFLWIAGVCVECCWCDTQKMKASRSRLLHL